MYSKKDYIEALRILNFEREPGTSTSGSHIRYVHKKYKNIYAGIDDHKNTKEISLKIHQDLIRSLLMVVWLETRNKNGKVDFEKAKNIQKGINKKLAEEIINKLEKLDYNSNSYLLAIIPKRLATEVSKAKKDLNNKSILDYLFD